jgi:hypothetical protein
MALPILEVPIYELKLPSSGKKIKYRSFLVKEEKILMIANETGEIEDQKRAIGQIITNCTFGELDYEEMPTFDVEYLFINIRAKSVGETVDLSVLCPDDKETRVDVNISLDDIKCKKPKKNFNVIKLNETIGIIMKYPTLRMKVDEKDGFRIVAECIESIYDEDTVYATADFSKDELDTFIDSMTQTQLEMVSEFFDGIPKVYKDIEVMNPKTKVKSKVRLEGMETFF